MKKKQLFLLLPLLTLTACSKNISIPSNLATPSSISDSSNQADSSIVEEEENEYGKFETNALYNEIENSLANGTLVEDYSDGNAYLVLRHALNKQVNSPYSLTIGESTVSALGGIYKQEVESATFVTPTESFNQNISSSSLVKTAFRFYDDYTDNIKAYESSTSSDWTADATPTYYTYDEYIQAYGKLFNGHYYCTSGGDDIDDLFLTRDEDVFKASEDESKREINALIIYDIDADTITGSSISKTDDGYEIIILLEDGNGTAYYQNQMLTTGSLSEKPNFSTSLLTFQLDSELYLTSSLFEDSYDLKKVISLSATQTMTQYYFHSETNTFTSGNKQVSVSIPTIDDHDFNGYNLFPKE